MGRGGWLDVVFRWIAQQRKTSSSSSHFRSARRGRFLFAVTTLLALACAAIELPILAVPASAASRAPIVIGYVCSCTGPTASANVVGPPAYQAWVDATNSAGGLNGHPVKLIIVDDEASPTVARADVTRLIVQDHVVALVDWSLVDAEWGSIAFSHHIPIIGANPEGSLSLASPDYFNTGTTAEAATVAGLEAVKKAGGHLGILYCAESPQCAETIPLIRKLAPEYGVKLSYTAAISFSAPNYTAPCLAAKGAGATAIEIADASLVVQNVASSCAEQGYRPTVVGGDGSLASTFLDNPLLKDKLLGYEPDIPFFLTNAPATRAMLKAFRKYEPSLLKNPNYGETAVQAWVSGLVLASAVKAGKVGLHGPVTSNELRNAMYAIPKGSTMGKMTPPLTYKRSKVTAINCWYWISTKDGHWATPYGLKPSCV